MVYTFILNLHASTNVCVFLSFLSSLLDHKQCSILPNKIRKTTNSFSLRNHMFSAFQNKIFPPICRFTRKFISYWCLVCSVYFYIIFDLAHCDCDCPFLFYIYLCILKLVHSIVTIRKT